jgi:hypothetical protein
VYIASVAVAGGGQSTPSTHVETSPRSTSTSTINLPPFAPQWLLVDDDPTEAAAFHGECMPSIGDGRGGVHFQPVVGGAGLPVEEIELLIARYCR